MDHLYKGLGFPFPLLNNCSSSLLCFEHPSLVGTKNNLVTERCCSNDVYVYSSKSSSSFHSHCRTWAFLPLPPFALDGHHLPWIYSANTQGEIVARSRKLEDGIRKKIVFNLVYF